MWWKLSSYALLAGIGVGGFAKCAFEDSIDKNSLQEYIRKQQEASAAIFHGDFIPYARPTDEDRQLRGCKGKNFIYNNDDISTQYFWSPSRYAK